MRWLRDDGYEVTTDHDRIDFEVVHRELAASYWSPGIRRAVVERAVAHSLPFSLLARGGAQAGFARAITDAATYAYLADVFVVSEHRGRGLGKWLVECVLSHPELQGLRRWALATRDAHGLYRRFGFAAAEDPELHMFKDRAPEDLWPGRGDGA